METLPHHYMVTANSSEASEVSLLSDNLPEIISSPPKQFGGKGNQWSPESLLVAAVADCFSLSFKAIAKASHFDWHSLNCNVTGTLDMEDKKLRFTTFKINAVLTLRQSVKEEKALALLEKAEHHCLISNSLSADVKLSAEVKLTP
jgi:peroxiredoxin-like protein